MSSIEEETIETSMEEEGIVVHWLAGGSEGVKNFRERNLRYL